MKSVIDIHDNAKLVFGRDQPQFEDIIETIGRTTRLAVASYSVPTFFSDKKVKSMPEGAVVEIVTALPAMCDAEKWWKSLATQLASIDNRILFRFDGVVSIFFNHKNHSKLVITDEAAYIGSANFTYGSTHNYEAGVCLFGRDIASRIYQEFFTPLANESKLFVGLHREIEIRLWHLLQITQELIECVGSEFGDREFVVLERLIDDLGRVKTAFVVPAELTDLINGWSCDATASLRDLLPELREVRNRFGTCSWQFDYDADRYLQLAFNWALEKTAEDATNVLSEAAHEAQAEESERQEAMGSVLSKLSGPLRELETSMSKLVTRIEERH